MIQVFGLLRCRGITPKLGRAHRLVTTVEGNESMLLGTYAESDDLAAALPDSLQATANDSLRSLQPDLRILRDMAVGQTFHKRMRSARLRQNLSGIKVQDQTLARGCPAIEADAQHCRI